MMENEAAYRKASHERESVHRLMKTTFDPSTLKRRHEAEKMVHSIEMQNVKSAESVSPLFEGQMTMPETKTQPSPVSAPWVSQERFYKQTGV
jgi:hypothetical protein